MEQVFPETPFGYRLLQVLIGSGYQTDVRLNLLFTAYGAVAFFLQGTQQCPLYLGIQIAHLVQKQCPMVGGGKHARLVFRRSGKGTLHITEQFRCRQFLREYATVHRNERCVSSSAQRMYLSGHILFACP